jgi:hypothetical protein
MTADQPFTREHQASGFLVAAKAHQTTSGDMVMSSTFPDLAD